MAESARAPRDMADDEHMLPSRAILRLVANGMSIRTIVQLFPAFSIEEVRAALLRVADLAQDESASLPAEDPLTELIERAQVHASLDEAEAETLALEVTKEVRQELNSKP